MIRFSILLIFALTLISCKGEIKKNISNDETGSGLRSNEQFDYFKDFQDVYEFHTLAAKSDNIDSLMSTVNFTRAQQGIYVKKSGFMSYKNSSESFKVDYYFVYGVLSFEKFQKFKNQLDSLPNIAKEELKELNSFRYILNDTLTVEAYYDENSAFGKNNRNEFYFIQK